MIRDLLARVVRGERLSRDEAGAAVRLMVRGGADAAVVAAFLGALAARGETGEELLGGALALRAEAVPFPSTRPVLLDTCGTGGDGSGTFNVSTTVALVAAAAGIPVAKHGNRSVSSRSGSADVLEALGARIELGPEGAARLLEETGFTFLYARRFHPAMRNVAEVRQALGIRTLFNWLGPLSNPARATHQLLGVPDRPRVEMVAEVLQGLGVARALVVHGAEGLDELGLAPGNTALEVTPHGPPAARSIEAGALGLVQVPCSALRGGEPSENARMTRSVLAGEKGPARDAVVLNAAAALWIAEGAGTLSEAAALATEQLDSGAAARTLDRYVALTHRVGDG
ncbi:MAG TPA: anthranilate phosphoribosyltransferase [Candidatus Eisenbacteria bacterium]|jgi:anthranilate phosphoribosyltransferase